MFAKQGHFYILGADAPFFVSKSMMANAGKDKGFDQVQVFDRGDFPKSQLPAIPSGSSNSWNTVARGRRAASDGEVSLPSEVKWVVDVTPVVAQPAPGPADPVPVPSQPSGPVVVHPGEIVPTSHASTGGSILDWLPIPPLRDTPSVSGKSSNMPTGLAMPILIVSGVVGGLFLGNAALGHMFKEGLSTQERNNILKFTAAVAALWGASQFVKLDEAWWLTPEGAAAKAQAQLK